MAEIILPPEENEETPQAPELNIDKPTENSKVITIEFEAKKTNKVSTKDTNQQLYTTDTDAWFEFKETSLEGANGTYSVVFRNRHDGSIFQRTGDVVNGIAYYKIPEQEIRHAGAWRGQLVYTLENGNTTAREFGYDVKGHILDGKDVREIVVEDFETLMSQLNSMKDNAELELADLVNTAERNELERQQFYESLVEDINDLQENYQELLDTGVLQTNINEKLEELEEEYAPKLTEVTAQLAQTDEEVSKKADLSFVNNRKRDNMVKIEPEDVSEEFLSLVTGQGTIDLKSVPQDNSVTPRVTTFVEGVNIFNGLYSNRWVSNGVMQGENTDMRTAILEIENQKKYFIKANGVHDRFNIYLANTIATNEPAKTLQIKTTPSGAEQFEFTNDENYKFVLITVSIDEQEPLLSVTDNTELVLGDDAIVRKRTNEIIGDYIERKTLSHDHLNFMDVHRNLFNGQLTTGLAIPAEPTAIRLISFAEGKMAVIEVPPSDYSVLVEGEFNRFGVALANTLEVNTTIEKLKMTTSPTTSESFYIDSTSGYKYLLVYVSSVGQEPNVYISEGNRIYKTESIEILNRELAFKDDLIELPTVKSKKYSTIFEDDAVESGAPSTHMELYNQFDELLTMGENVTKEVLGETTEGNELLSYKITREPVPNTTNLRRPKVGILASIHGDEKGPAVATLNFLKTLVENKHNNDVLNKIKSNIDFYVIPTGNPTGWDNDSRHNGNGVDLNRNFTEGWKKIETWVDNSGVGPASEIETQIIEDWLAENEFDYFIDFHNTAYGNSDWPDEIDTLSWFVGDNNNKETLERQYVKVMNLLSHLWSEKNNEFPSDKVFGYARNLTGATALQQASTTGAKSVVLEASWKIGYVNDVKYGKITNQFATELLGNYLFEVCKYFI